MKGARVRFLVTVLLCSSTIAAAAPPVATPAQVSAAIDKAGARAFFSSLDEQDTERLFDRMGTGQTGWVELAPKLAEGADGANAEGLIIALAYALPKNPATVLKVADPLEGDSHILAISRLCGIPFIDPPPKNYKAKALRAVAAVKAVAPHVKKRCLEALRKS